MESYQEIELQECPICGGAGLAIKNGSKIVKPAIIIVLILLAAKVIQGLITG